MKKLSVLLKAVCILGLGAACGIDTIPSGLQKTPPGDGPFVKFDIAHRPLPEVPIPNDFATFPDPTSRTGRRINVSLVAPTHYEKVAREDFTTMEGWGTSAPMTVSFEKPAGSNGLDPAIDLEDVAARTQGDDHDLSNDPFYIVNLKTGVPMFVDVGNGYFPVTVRDPWRYMPNDPKAGEPNLWYETTEEGAGLPQSAYRPELDRDFDGVLDHPNTLGNRGLPGIDNLLTWYERETDTLVLRPILPLDEKTEYAVVLTDRLRGSNGKPIRSPFENVYHPTQESGIARLREILNDQNLAAYYGDIVGTGLSHVAFAWTFTTQPTREDMELLRNGLYGTGPFSRWAKEFPPEMTIAQAAGTVPADEPQPPGWQDSSPKCQRRAQRPYLLRVADQDIREALDQFFIQVFDLDPGDLKAMQNALEYVDHVVVGTYKSPYLLGDPASIDPDTRFHINFKTGEGDVRPDDVQFFIVVPKITATAKQPFPVGFWGHGVTGHADEVLFYAGDYARQGIAMIGYNNPEHGLVLDPGDRSIASGQLSTNCLVPFLDGFQSGRAHDLNGDGKGDSGWFWWTAHIFHTRDNVRQGILDGMQAVRILRTFDGHVGTQDFTGDGIPDVAGDFDGDGTPDVGGPNVGYFAAGESLGGIMSDIQGGIDPYMIASAPMSGGGMLALDVGFRSYGVTEAVTSQLIGPVVVALPATDRPEALQGKDLRQIGTRCTDKQRTVRIIVNEGDLNHELEIACLNPDELDAGMTVVVSNVTTGEVRCARTDAGGLFRVPIPTSENDALDIQIYNKVDAVKSYDGCEVFKDIPPGRRISTWEQKALAYGNVADSEKSKCDVAEGCAQFRDHFYPVNSQLVAPNEGLALRRQSPSLRRFGELAQAAFDPADPVNYAAYYMLKPFLDENGNRVGPHALFNINTVGDNFVPVSAGFNFARAAGALPFLPPSALARYPAYADYVTPQELYDALGRKTPMQHLIDTHSVEGIARLARTTSGPACKANYRNDGNICKGNPVIDPYDCQAALYDADWVSEGGLPFDQPHSQVPLRLGRLAGLHVTDAASLQAAWEPRLRGVPFSADDKAWSAREPIVAAVNYYIDPRGKHTWDVGDVCKAWDFATYGNRLTARFFATQGRDLYYLSHPQSHGCLLKGTCDFFQ